MRASLKSIFIFLFFIFVGILSAQNTIAHLEGEALVLPESWSFRYEPAQVLVKVKVEADSTLSFIKVLDEKPELSPLLQEFLSKCKANLLSVSVSPDTELNVIIDLIQVPPAYINLITQGKTSDVKKIELWIEKERKSLSFHQPIQDSVSANVFLALNEPYRSGFFSYSRPQYYNLPNLYGFTLQHSLYSSSFINNLMLGLFNLQEEIMELNAIEKNYPYEVTLSDIEAGIGDYEHLYTRVALKKNNLFDYKDLYLSLDFLTQRGYWLEEDASRNALKLYLSVPLGKTKLNFSWIDLNSKLSMLNLSPEFWLPQNYVVKDHYNALYAAFDWAGPNLAILYEQNDMKSDKFIKDLHNDALHLQAWKNLQMKKIDLALKYEHIFSDYNYETGEQAYKDRAEMQLCWNLNPLKWDMKAELTDFQQVLLATNLSYSLNKFGFGTFAQGSFNELESSLWIPSIYNESDSLRNVQIREINNVGVYTGYSLNPNIFISLSLGRKTIENIYPELETEFKEEKKLPYIRLGGKLNKIWNKWEIQWQPSLTWQSNVEGLFEEPEFEGSSYLNLFYHLPYNNAIFSGFSLIGHSGYWNSDTSTFYIDSSSIIDLWAGVQISNRFEFQVSYKNLMDTSIYGVYPVPPSIYASVRWFFLN
ncbi:MAG TPA: hypothetical protein PKH17_02940 [Candidatus Syntrophosphaera sp.]|nr:hypothetical protein [Candidatus Syntrophosphaera sp.]